MSRAQAVSVLLKAVLAATVVGAVVVIGALDNSGCATDSLFTDLGTVEALCRAPSGCYENVCACTRDDGKGGALATSALCLVPTQATGACDTSSQRCRLPGTQCAGRAAAVCPGVGARCLPVHGDCSQAGGNPPDRVGSGPNGTLENHCTYVDDVCCPGNTDVDGGTLDPDAGT